MRLNAKRGGQRVKQDAKFRIDGEYVAASDIAARLGVSDRRARTYLARAQSLDGPVTWDRLRTIQAAASFT